MLADHRLVAEGLSSALQSSEIVVSITASSWSELIKDPAMPVSVAVVDLDLDDGVPISTKIRALRRSGVACVVINSWPDTTSVLAALRGGAVAFVAKTDSIEKLQAAIMAAARGELTLDENSARARSGDDPPPSPGLGQNEERALVFYAGGRSIREVAADMNTTVETVKSYIKRGRRKYLDAGIDIGTRILLRHHATREGWLSHK